METVGHQSRRVPDLRSKPVKDGGLSPKKTNELQKQGPLNGVVPFGTKWTRESKGKGIWDPVGGRRQKNKGRREGNCLNLVGRPHSQDNQDLPEEQ